MLNAVLLFLLLPAAFSYTDESYPYTSFNEGEPQLEPRSERLKDRAKEISLRSVLDKNIIRMGRGDLPPLLDVDNPVDSDENVARFDRYARFGGGNFMRFGRGSNNFMRFGRGNRDFMRFGRDGSGFLRFGRDSGNPKQTRSQAESFLRFGRTFSDFGATRKKREAFAEDPTYKRYSTNFLRFGKREGDDEAERPTGQYENRNLVQLLTDLDCTMEQRDKAKCTTA